MDPATTDLAEVEPPPPGLRMRCLRRLIRARIRRRNWGQGERLARRARRVFGMPRLLLPMLCRGTTTVPAEFDGVHGEWQVPENRNPGADVLLYLHGGGFVAGDPRGHRPITSGLARRLGMAVYCPDYRLAPEHPYPAALEDVERVAAALVTAGHRIALLAGDSAGGGLCLALWQRLCARRAEAPDALLLFSPWADLRAEGHDRPTTSCDMFHLENFAAFADCYRRPDQATDPMVSPVCADSSGIPRTLIQVGAEEMLLHDAVLLAHRIGSAGGDCTVQRWPGAFHCWQIFAGVLPEADRSLDQAVAWAIP